ncbi:hypothetical protein I302_103847 [Kwoniella bestiolae CBS 10118]|uniref:Uncharacterized protein n=1 Tax=Kwoniella bestiolae CBS 10118 TaxID=1296100 RepID=A0A1B9G9I6_9TREE|nr:hypothetical protein I302_02550 [Kwoniella bestiolae CBS 10118]OCF27705.1 hypothetical protein I302_02550 [Kwoniella bestiolae CBS 10118]
MSYQERVALDTLLYKEDERSASSNTGTEKEQGNHIIGGEEKGKEMRGGWHPFSGHCKFKFPLKPPPALRDKPDDTPQEKRKKFGKRLAYWGALSSGGSNSG